ncbi:MAG: DNA-directed RNA polymerase subunit alpha C-terminal domain-containing protein [Phycisphaerae bacterium]
MSEASAELMSFFEAAQLDAESVETCANLAYESARACERFGELVKEYCERVESGEGDAVKAGVGYLILGRFQQALEWLEKARGSKYRHYYAGRAAAALGRYDEALSAYRRAAAAGWDGFDIDMLTAALQIQAGGEAAAEKLIAAHERDGEDRGEWYFVRGFLTEKRDERDAAIELYEKALALSPDHAPAMFRTAWLYDLRGDDDKAIDLYKRLAIQPRAHVNALINLAVIHEDNGNFEEAIVCLRRVLAAYPSHARARLFLRDVESSREMVIDDAIEKRVETRNRLLETPISEFELSVRARNCLKKMSIQTLGDLLKLTEAELLSYKNFGETSLHEIGALLQKRGLRLGQDPEEIDALALVEPPPAKVSVPPGSEALLTKPVSEMELSVRARRCLQRLNIDRLGDLIQHTEAELLATRNFGVTSLNEIKARLSEFGLCLAAKS